MPSTPTNTSNNSAIHRPTFKYGVLINLGSYAVLVLSRHSLAKNWPRQESDAVLALEESGRKRVLPLIYGVSRDEVAEAFPLIADRLSADAALGMDRVVDDILSVVKPSAKVARAPELIDFSHQQSDWMNLSSFSENRDGLTKMTKSWLEQPELLDSAQVVLVPPPFHCDSRPRNWIA